MPTRREFLTRDIPAFVFGASGLFVPEAPKVKAQEIYIPPAVEPFLEDKNEKGIFRAGSVTIWGRNSMGHGFIRVDDDDKLHLVTAHHVIDDIVDPLFHVPGVGIGSLESSDTIQNVVIRDVYSTDVDAQVEFEFSDAVQEFLKKQAQKGELTPLITEYGQLPDYGTHVVIPRADTGRYTELEHVPFPDEFRDLQGINLFAMRERNRGVICAGRSGSPVLKLNGYTDDGQLRVSNIVYGIVVANSKIAEHLVGDPEERMRDCAEYSFARPAQ